MRKGQNPVVRPISATGKACLFFFVFFLNTLKLEGEDPIGPLLHPVSSAFYLGSQTCPCWFPKGAVTSSCALSETEHSGGFGEPELPPLVTMVSGTRQTWV